MRGAAALVFDDACRLLVVHCTIVSGEPALQPTDALSAVEWLPPDAIPEPRSNVLHRALENIR